MTRTEHLLVCLAEEAAEIQQSVTKALRFGLNDTRPGHHGTNSKEITIEFYDLIAVGEMLQNEGIIPVGGLKDKCIADKKVKVEKWLKYAEQQGTVEAPHD